MAVPEVSATTDAVLVRLATSGVAVGDGRKPDDAGWQGTPGASEFVTYCVLYPLNHLRDGPDASIADRHSDPQHRYQLTTVGIDRVTTEMAQDLAAAVLLNGVALSITGRAHVQTIHETAVGVTADETTNPPLFIGVDRYRVDTANP